MFEDKSCKEYVRHKKKKKTVSYREIKIGASVSK